MSITRRAFIAIGSAVAVATVYPAPAPQTALSFYPGRLAPFAEEQAGLRRLRDDLRACDVHVATEEYPSDYRGAKALRGRIGSTFTVHGDYFPASFGQVLKGWHRDGQCRAVTMTRGDKSMTAWTGDEMQALVSAL